MNLTLCQFPDQPCLHGSEEQLASLGSLSGAFNVVEQPFSFRSGEVGVDHQSCLLAEGINQSLGF